MEKIICGQSIEKGQIIEITVPNVEKPIKTVVLDVTEFDIMDTVRGVSLICYAQKRLFKISYKYCFRVMLDSNNHPYKDGEYYNYKYEGIIVEHCEIPDIPSDI